MVIYQTTKPFGYVLNLVMLQLVIIHEGKMPIQAGSIIGKSPTNWVQHHDIENGLMQLVPKSQHPNVPGGIFWETLHPGKKGGFSIWGKK